MPRILFGSNEDRNITIPYKITTTTTNSGDSDNDNDSKSTSTDSTKSKSYWKHKNFDSLRWKYHTNFHSPGFPPKSIIDVSKLDLKKDVMFLNDKVVKSIHAPIVGSKLLRKRKKKKTTGGGHSNNNNYNNTEFDDFDIDFVHVEGCIITKNQKNIYNTRKLYQPFVIYHYLGSLVNYLSRPDPRRKEMKYILKNRGSNDAIGDTNIIVNNVNVNNNASTSTITSTMKNNDNNNDDNNNDNQAFELWISGWLDHFIDTYGINNTVKVLGGTIF